MNQQEQEVIGLIHNRFENQLSLEERNRYLSLERDNPLVLRYYRILYFRVRKNIELANRACTLVAILRQMHILKGGRL